MEKKNIDSEVLRTSIEQKASEWISCRLWISYMGYVIDHYVPFSSESDYLEWRRNDNMFGFNLVFDFDRNGKLDK